MLAQIAKHEMIKRPQKIQICKLAGIQYHGISGATQPCIHALSNLISGSDRIVKALLITSGTRHAFVLFPELDGIVAVKPGFTSGYSGEGPHGLAVALILLYRHRIDVDEHLVDEGFMERIEQSCLLTADLETLEKNLPVRPSNWYSYIHHQGLELPDENSKLSSHYKHRMPFEIIDHRIADLAVEYYVSEDHAILTAFRRLEDHVRKRTGLDGEGSKLFSKAFMGNDAPLQWDVPDQGEAIGRGNLFTAVYMAFRNARTHREIQSGTDEYFREFLLVNELFRLEAEAMTEMELQEKRKEQEDIDQLLKELKASRA